MVAAPHRAWSTNLWSLAESFGDVRGHLTPLCYAMCAWAGEWVQVDAYGGIEGWIMHVIMHMCSLAAAWLDFRDKP